MEAKSPIIVDSIYHQNLSQNIHVGGVNISETLSIDSSKEHLTVKPPPKRINKDRNEPIFKSTFVIDMFSLVWSSSLSLTQQGHQQEPSSQDKNLKPLKSGFFNFGTALFGSILSGYFRLRA